MLRVTGHPAALLDGGLGAWRGALARGCEAEGEPGDFTAEPWPPARLFDLTDLDRSSDEQGLLLLDARNADRFRGEHDPVDPRPGHIPGARNLPCRDNLRPDGTFLSPFELRERFEEAGVRSGDEVVSYCGSGVTACHNLLPMEHAGFAPGRLFPGSWSQYSRTDRPVATGRD